MNRYPVVTFDRLAVELINRTLDLELEPGLVRMSAAVHEKIATKHAAHYALCMAHLPAALADPSYIGAHPHHAAKIELIRRVVRSETSVLVAIGIEPDRRGAYGIASAYCVTEMSITRWRLSGRLLVPIK